MTRVADFNRDGYPDLLLHFHIRDLTLTLADTQAVLYGQTFSGQRLRGSDSVRIVPFQFPTREVRNNNPPKRNQRAARLPR